MVWRAQTSFDQALDKSINVWLLVFLRRDTKLKRERTKTAVFQGFVVFSTVHTLRVPRYLPGYLV